MTVGDVVVTTHEHAIVVGDVISGWSWTPSSDGTTNLRRSVEWRNPDTPIDFSDLPAPLPAHLQTGRTLVDLTDDLDLIDALTDSTRDIEIAVSVDPELVVGIWGPSHGRGEAPSVLYARSRSSSTSVESEQRQTTGADPGATQLRRLASRALQARILRNRTARRGQASNT